MKKITGLIMICVLSLSFIGCEKNKDSTTEELVTTETATTEEEVEVSPPDISQIRAICELATLECYFHNVAKSTQEKGTGLSHLGEVDRTFWIEYTGVTKVGIDMSKLKMETDGTTINITMPKAEIMSCEVMDDLNENNYISSNDGLLNKNPITAEKQTAAVNKAQQDMRERVENDEALLSRARENAKRLIENYIKKLGDAASIEYVVNWNYSEEE